MSISGQRACAYRWEMCCPTCVHVLVHVCFHECVRISGDVLAERLMYVCCWRKVTGKVNIVREVRTPFHESKGLTLLVDVMYVHDNLLFFHVVEFYG